MTRSNSTATASVLLSPLLNLFRALEALGIDAAALFRTAGCDPALLQVPETRVPPRTVERLYALSESATSDPCFGIEVGKQFRGVAMHALGFAWLSSPSLGDGIRRLARYTRVLTDLWRAEIRDEERGVRYSVIWLDPALGEPMSRHDLAISALVQLCRITYGEAFAPIEVTTRREPGPCNQRYADWFRAPIIWSAPRQSILFRWEDLARPLPTSNPGVAVASEQLVVDYLARRDRDDITTQVRHKLLALFPSGAPTQETTARALGLSTRTLQRRLAESGTSFAQLLDETRRELSGDYLRSSDYAVGEIAFMLGFAETSSFNRAFRRWTGQSPSEFRAALAPTAATAPDKAH